MTRRTAPEIIGFHFGWDINDVRDCRYQSTRYANPAIYTIGDYYYCCPSSSSQKMPMKPTIWVFVATYYDRSIYRVHMNEIIERA